MEKRREVLRLHHRGDRSRASCQRCAGLGLDLAPAGEVDSGLAYLYFFPQGYTERAQVYVRQGNNVWTLPVSPLTGQASIVGGELEVPKS